MWGPKSPKADNASSCQVVKCRCQCNASSSSGPHDSSGLQGTSLSQESLQTTCGCSSNSLDSISAQINSLAEPLCQLSNALDSIQIPTCDSQESLPGPQPSQPSTLSLPQENLSGSESCEAIEFCCVQTSSVQRETQPPEPPQHHAQANPLEALCKCLEKAATKHHCQGS